MSRFVIVPLLIVWWAAAVRRYLCIPHGWAVAALHSLMLFLALVAALYVSGGLAPVL